MTLSLDQISLEGPGKPGFSVHLGTSRHFSGNHKTHRDLTGAAVSSFGLSFLTGVEYAHRLVEIVDGWNAQLVAHGLPRFRPAELGDSEDGLFAEDR